MARKYQRKCKGKKRKANPQPEPQSHYARLDDSYKATIRPFGFLGLPAELRNKIYSLLVVVPDPRIADGGDWDPSISNSRVGPGRLILPTNINQRVHEDCGRPELNILRVCKTISREADEVFDAKNIFEIILYPSYQPRYLHNIPYRINLVKHLRILITVDEDEDEGLDFHTSIDLFSLYRQAVSLQMLQLALRIENASVEVYDYSPEYLLKSAYFHELLSQAVRGVRTDVEIKWGVWKEIDVGHYDADYLDIDTAILKDVGRQLLSSG